VAKKKDMAQKPVDASLTEEQESSKRVVVKVSNDVGMDESQAVLISFSAAAQRESNAPRRIMITLDETGEALWASSFTKPLFLKWVKETLRAGSTIIHEKDGTPRVEYRLALPQEIEDLAAEGLRVSLPARNQTGLRRAVEKYVNNGGQEPTAPASGADGATDGVTRQRREPVARTPKAKKAITFLFTIPKKGKERDERFGQLSGQARKIIEIIAESGQTKRDVEGLTKVLVDGAPAKGLDPVHVYRRFFRFAFTPNYIVYDGLVTKKEG
jgi:hypothetical protein